MCTIRVRKNLETDILGAENLKFTKTLLSRPVRDHGGAPMACPRMRPITAAAATNPRGHLIATDPVCEPPPRMWAAANTGPEGDALPRTELTLGDSSGKLEGKGEAAAAARRGPADSETWRTASRGAPCKAFRTRCVVVVVVDVGRFSGAPAATLNKQRSSPSSSASSLAEPTRRWPRRTSSSPLWRRRRRPPWPSLTVTSHLPSTTS